MRYLTFIIAIAMISAILSRPSQHRTPSPQAIAGNADASSENENAASAESAPSPDGAIELERNSDGHFYADVQINGTTAHMLVDTGASEIALSREDARRAGVATSIGMNDVIGRGADGDVHGDVVTLDRVELGGMKAEKMQAMVLNGGDQSLLGQSFLSQFKSVQIEGDKMVLR
jgi:aspartyl protease family protein